MIELLLQAENALAGGMLDQAERVYWQLIERDAQNAIAVAGLARVCLERGDLETAHLFAAKALVLDPDSVAAQKVVEALEQGPGLPPVEPADVPELPLLAAERLEALSRRRRAEEEPSAESGAAESPAGASPFNFAAGVASRRRDQIRQAVTPPADASDAAEKPAQAPPTAGGARQAKPVPKPRPHGEPPRGLRKRPGAAPEPVVDLEADQFAAAEAAAAIEAIDAVDTFEIEPPRPRGARAADIARRRKDPSGAPEPSPEAVPEAAGQATPAAGQDETELPGSNEAEQDALREAMATAADSDEAPESVAGRQLDSDDWTPEADAESTAAAETTDAVVPAAVEPLEDVEPADDVAETPVAAEPDCPAGPATESEAAEPPASPAASPSSAPKPVAPRSTAPARPQARHPAPQSQQRPKKGLLRRILGG